jgi:hypothetical protein
MKIRKLTVLLALSAAMQESHKGKELILGGLKFVDGKSSFTGTEDQVMNKATHLNRNFEVEHEIVETPTYPAPPPEHKEDVTLSEAQLMANERLAAALMKLDHADDAHWNTSGLPALKAVCNFYGSADVTRAAIEAALPGLKRLPIQLVEQEAPTQALTTEQANPAAVAQGESKEANLGNEQNTGA